MAAVTLTLTNVDAADEDGSIGHHMRVTDFEAHLEVAVAEKLAGHPALKDAEVSATYHPEPREPIVDGATIEEIGVALRAQPEVDQETASQALHLIHKRSYDEEYIGEVGPEYIIDHALEDAGVGREERLAVLDSVLEREQ